MSNTYKDERKKILELLQSGTISASEAEALIEALTENEGTTNFKQTTNQTSKDPFRMLRIKVESASGDHVNIKIPVEFAGLLKTNRFGNVKLNEFDIDINAILQMIENGAFGELVSIDTEDGDVIRISIE